MKRIVILASGLLAACNSGQTVTADNASADEVADKVAAAGGAGPKMSPGHWQLEITTTRMEMPDMPPAAAKGMKAMMGKPKAFGSCLTPEMAAKPKGDFFGGNSRGAGDNDCRYDHFTMGDGKMDGAMTCADEDGPASVEFSGTYGADTYHVNTTFTGPGSSGNPNSGMSMAMTIDGQRTGPCTGNESNLKVPR